LKSKTSICLKNCDDTYKKNAIAAASIAVMPRNLNISLEVIAPGVVCSRFPIIQLNSAKIIRHHPAADTKLYEILLA
jgi:hypothetical protein